LKKFGTNERIASFVLFVLAFGTNIVYYVFVEPSMAHIYSFALISGFIYVIIKTNEKNNTWWWVLAATLLSLTIITRPTNGIFIFLIPFVAGSFSKLKQILIAFFTNYKALFLSVIASSVVLLVPILLWYLQTGHFIVYSYGEEGFNFSEPHFFIILFSYNKGWFLYTPVAFVSMFGFAGLYKENKFRFFVLLALLVVHIYITSSWWVWHYTSKYSQRVFIDFYAIIGILLAYMLMFVQQKKNFKNIIYTILSILIFFNLFQFYQHYKWVFPYGNITKEIYWDSFSGIVPKARVFISEEKIENKKHIINDFEKNLGWGNETCIASYKGNKVAILDSSNVFSVEFRDTFPAHFSSGKRIIKIGTDIFSNLKYSDASLVTEFQIEDKTYSYNSFFLKTYNKQNKWVHVDYALYTPEPITPIDFVKIFFFNGNPLETLLVDNMSIEFISVQNEKSLIDNVRKASSNIKSRKKEINSFEEDIGWENYATVTSEKAYTGIKSCKINKTQPFSVLFEEETNNLFTSETKLIIVRARVNSDTDVDEIRFIIDLKNGNESVSYNTFGIKNKFQTGKWSLVTINFVVPELEPEADKVRIYFWSPAQDEQLFIDDVEFEFISL